MDEGALMDATTEQQQGGAAWLKVAIACGVLPLLAGIMSLIVFLQSDPSSGEVEGWMDLGVTILMVGLALFSAGLVTLGVYVVKAGRSGVPKRDLAQNAILTLILLMANFPAALACIWVAGDALNRVHISFVNESDMSVEELTISWPGGSQDIKELGPRGRAELSFYVGGEGEVSFSARQGDERCEGVLIGYVTPNLAGESLEVSFSGGCEFTAAER